MYKYSCTLLTLRCFLVSFYLFIRLCSAFVALHSFPEECSGKRTFAPLLRGISGHGRVRMQRRRQTLFLPLSSIIDNHPPHLPPPRPPTPHCLLCVLLISVLDRGSELIFSRVRGSQKLTAALRPHRPQREENQLKEPLYKLYSLTWLCCEPMPNIRDDNDSLMGLE